MVSKLCYLWPCLLTEKLYDLYAMNMGVCVFIIGKNMKNILINLDFLSVLTYDLSFAYVELINFD